MTAKVSEGEQLFDTEVESIRVIAKQLDGMKNYNLSCMVWIAVAIATRKIEDMNCALRSAKHASQRSHKADVLVVLVLLFAEKNQMGDAFATAADLSGLSTSRHAQARIVLADITGEKEEADVAQAEIKDIEPDFLKKEAIRDLNIISSGKARHTGLCGSRYSGHLKALRSFLEGIMALHRSGAHKHSHLSLGLYWGADAVCLQLMSEVMSR